MRRAAALSVMFAAALGGGASSTVGVDRAGAEPVTAVQHACRHASGFAPLPGGGWRTPPIVIHPQPHPLDGVTDQTLERWLLEQPERLGPASIGTPTRGALRNGVQLTAQSFWDIRDPEHAWGTPAMVQCLAQAIEHVHRTYPGAPPLRIGDVSREHGGWLRHHRSHQSGRDVDLGFYYRDDLPWYTKANARNLDRTRTWALVRSLMITCDVDMILVDRTVMDCLREHAELQGEDSSMLDEVFGAKPRRGIVRHAWGHQTHLHVRFRDLTAERTGERLQPLVQRLKSTGRLRGW